jgi:NADH-quinone oxidoreductase subunit M
MEGPAGLTALITGIKVGAYGLLRLGIPLAPEAALHFAPWLTGLGIAGVFYGALLALRQHNLRKLLAYASISHVGLVVVAMSVMNLNGIQGAVFQLVNFSLVSGGLFLIAGCLQQRLGSTDRVHLGGLAGPMPLLTAFAFLFLAAGIGIPGTNGFVAEWLMLLGIFEHHGGLSLALLIGTVLGAAYSFGFFRVAFLGPAIRSGVRQTQDLRPRELLLFAGLALVVLSLGLYPRPLIKTMDAAAATWVKQIGGGLLEQPSLFASAKRVD